MKMYFLFGFLTALMRKITQERKQILSVAQLGCITLLQRRLFPLFGLFFIFPYLLSLSRDYRIINHGITSVTSDRRSMVLITIPQKRIKPGSGAVNFLPDRISY